MRKVIIGLALSLILISVSSNLFAGEGSGWFDMKTCEICKPMGETEGFMANVKWESYNISNGIMSVTTVTKGFGDKYSKAHDAMMVNWGRVEAGEKLKMCGMCDAYTAAWDESISMENIATETGYVSLTTSINPETVVKLQAIVERTNKEMAAMMDSHAGHQH